MNADLNKSEWDGQRARNLADSFDTYVLSIPFLYDVRPTGPTAERLRALVARSDNDPIVFAAPLPLRATESLLSTMLDLPGLDPQRQDRRVCPDVFKAIIEYQPNAFDETVAAISLHHVRQDGGKVESLEEPTTKRWYPVIDGTRCTGCLECVNFCLFGVYVIGERDRPVVDQPDACRDGCPACSRVCPARAIMFPLHEDKMIAGYAVDNTASDVDARDYVDPGEKAQQEKTLYLDELVDAVDRFEE